jgi:hypothetical protein
MWVLKTKGQTFYINHLECNIPFSTKETTDNPHTKGSIKFKNCNLIIDINKNAYITRIEK